MRVVFMGTPQIAAIVLERLAEEHDVVGVFTKADAVRGRGSALSASCVKRVADALGIPVFTPSSLKGGEAMAILEDLDPDVICVAAYGMILPKAVLDLPKHGCLNVHASLLPRWRGAAPIERAILAGDENTGVCIMRMEVGLDTGDWCRRAIVPVGDSYTEELAVELGNVGAEELVAALSAIQAGCAQWTAQGEEGVTYAAKLEKGELALDPADSAGTTVAKVHASTSAHPARMVFAGKTITVERAVAVTDEEGIALAGSLNQGEAVFARKRLLLRAAEGVFELQHVRPDGKKSMDARSFAGGIQGMKKTTVSWGRV